MIQIQNLVRHPIDATSLVLWIMDEWNQDDCLGLLVICPRGEGEAVLNRIRVRMAKTRAALKKNRIEDYKQFGIDAHIFQWTDENGREMDALALEHVIHLRHTFAMVKNKVF